VAAQALELQARCPALAYEEVRVGLPQIDGQVQSLLGFGLAPQALDKERW
jgi:hypothetical protein